MARHERCGILALAEADLRFLGSAALAETWAVQKTRHVLFANARDKPGLADSANVFNDSSRGGDPVASETPALTREIEAGHDRHRERRMLWRLAAWGGAAALSLVAVALVSQTESGSQRLHMALAGTHGRDDAVMLAAAERRADQAQAETRRLVVQLRELSADRNRLNTRLASLERSVSDMTGSISRQIAAVKASSPGPASPPALPSPLFAPLVLPAGPTATKPGAAAREQGESAKPVPVVDKPASTKATSIPAAASSEAKAIPLRSTPAAGAEVMVAPLPAPSGPAKPDVSHASSAPQMLERLAPKVVTTVRMPVPPARVAALTTGQPPQAAAKHQYAVSLGSARSSDFLRAQWAEVKANFGPLFSGLRPLLAHERRFGHPTYRLLVGPLPSAGAAARLCARLAIRHCHSARFVGQPLAER